MSNYDAQTINSRNPFARHAHRNRIQRSLKILQPRIVLGKTLDYGCGTGVLVSRINDTFSDSAVGYEPFMVERARPDLPVYSNFSDIVNLGPFHTVTLFETIEHLTELEFDEFLQLVSSVLDENGAILFSAPIEIGPALLLKELNRYLSSSKAEYHLLELFKAAFLASPGRRAENIKTSHKGFDFRQSLRLLSSKGWNVSVIGYGPLPIGTWYGNSQVFFWAKQIAQPDNNCAMLHSC